MGTGYRVDGDIAYVGNRLHRAGYRPRAVLGRVTPVDIRGIVRGGAGGERSGIHKLGDLPAIDIVRPFNSGVWRPRGEENRISWRLGKRCRTPQYCQT